MILSKENLAQIQAEGIEKPTQSQLELPEKVLQFGTGVLLRGLPDYFIDKANKAGIFNGRVIIVKSTSQGGTDDFSAQDGLYTLFVQGIRNGNAVSEKIINGSVSRVVSAKDEWNVILDCATNPELQIVVSNTTEVGLTLVEDDRIDAAPPKSFPGKLLAFLHRRYQHFNGSADAGMVIIPTELIPGNGALLKSICQKLAINNGLEEAFLDWLNTANDFCNSLVDRIVPGKLPADEIEKMAAESGYADNLMIASEDYRLWAIETGSERTKSILSFSAADAGIIIAPNIDKYRELKLRLLNGGHTFTCALAILSGFTTVKEAMSNSFFEQFITRLMRDEIAPAITSRELTIEEAHDFAGKVLDRFRNPFIQHQWLSISVQYSSKMAMRCIPVLLAFYQRFSKVPEHIAIGFGAYILFMKSSGERFEGRAGERMYAIQDDKAARLQEHWKSGSIAEAVQAVLSDETLWNTDLTTLPGFKDAVAAAVKKLTEERTGTASKPGILIS